jgi:hypothetical protein
MKSEPNPIDDMEPERWLAEMPALPTAVAARLEAAGVNAYWHTYNDAPAPGTGRDIGQSYLIMKSDAVLTELPTLSRPAPAQHQIGQATTPPNPFTQPPGGRRRAPQSQ